MKTEFHLNGTAALILTPETELEKAIVKDLLGKAKLGKKVTLVSTVEVDGKLSQLKVSVEA